MRSTQTSYLKEQIEILHPELEKFFGRKVFFSLKLESLDSAFLSKEERVYFKNLKIEKRKADWLRGKAALKDLLRRVGESEDSSLIKFPHPRISLSHSSGYAIAVGLRPEDCEGITGIGVDLELGDPKKLESGRFFLAEPEKASLESSNFGNTEAKSLELMKIWNIKEACFKSDPENTNKGLKDYVLDPEDKPENPKIKCFHQVLPEGFLTIALRYA